MAFWKWIRLFYESTIGLWVFILMWLYNYKTRNILHNRNNALAGGKPAIVATKFKVYIYKAELENIKRWVRAKDHIETGGDLFGLWLDKHEVVVQFVLGPGKNCRRSETSFYQDIGYLRSVGDYLTRNHGLCNIGQWHSHHRLDLPRPSIGDENTVWNNMPGLEMERYVVFIATIKDSGMTIFKESKTVNVNCFLFEIDNETKTQLPVLEGEICVIQQEHSPMHMCRELTALLKSGMEHEGSNDNDDSVVIGMDI